MSALLWGLTALKFSFTWVRHKGRQDPPIWIVFHILGLNLKISYQIAFLFDMYIDMGERIAGESKIGLVWLLKTPSGPPK